MSHVGSDVGVRGSKKQEETGVPGEKTPAEAWLADHLPSRIRPFVESEIRSRDIRDSVEDPGRALCAAFLVGLASRVDKVHLLQFDLKSRDLIQVVKKLGIENVEFHRGSGLSDEWIQSSLNIDTDLVKYLKGTGCLHGNQTVAIVIDSISNHILHRPTPYTCQTIHSLANKKNFDCDVKQVVCLLHGDLHDNQQLSLLEHTSTSVVRLTSPVSSHHNFSCSTLHKKATGKVIRITEEFTISEHFTVSNIQEVKKSTPKLSVMDEDNSVDPTANLTFNLSLTDKEKEARSNVVLPYTKQQEIDSQGNSPGEGKIFYQPDEADDFDEEDPDDDLDI
ncbi:hypothetical protein FSP39_002012 [Pinctada imbricata]|uniref:Elongator complex protein 5 n=1 Tax=Pinctada imbricata TaxID=66713 RepID=A0AA89C155_PINIB|nr:hypothetical protein FSP39_002012 [Pinctada imbricata]